MRLTLRTVLAYLDDVLEPADAREIGEKLAESKEAGQLVSRIREVLRRRRIGAPELAGPGSGPDPNLVADYIENTLPPAQVVELERLCQSSDVHLAEVAACHKILTMVMGQPLDVPDDVRERMYALGATRAKEDGTDGVALMPPMAEGMEQTLEGHTLRDGLPEYLTRSSDTRKLWIGAAVVLAAVGWLALVVFDRSLWPGTQEIAKTITSKSAPATTVVPEEPAEARPAPAPVAAQPQPQPQPPQQPQPGPMEPAQNPIAAVTPPTPMPVELPMSPPLSQQPTEQASDSSVPPPPVPLINPGPPAPLTEAPAFLAEKDLNYVSGDEIVLQRLTPNAPWRVIDSQTPIHPGEEIATPVPFKNEYALDSLLTLTFEPGSRAKRIPRSDDSEVALILDQGRLIVARSALAKEPVSIRLIIAGRSWLLTLLDPATKVGVEVHRSAASGLPGHASHNQIAGGLAVAEGRVNVVADGGTPLELSPENGFVQWPAQGTTLNTQTGLGTPAWLQADGSFVTPSARQLARTYQKEFLSDRSVTQSIGPVVKDRRAAISDLAAQTLALLDQYQDLVPALGSEHAETRRTAIQGIRQWLVLDPGNAAILRDELGRSFRQDSIEPLVRLLWGFDANDLKNPDISRTLVDWLMDDEIAIRELAFFHISHLTGRRYDYLPMAPLNERRAGAARWEEHLRRNNGALIGS